MIKKYSKENIELAASIIKKGGLVAFPTETVYGLGADGFNPIAVAKIFEAKNRPAFNPLILHVAEKEDIQKVTTCRDEKVFDLIEKFMPGPLTLILPKTEGVPEIVTAGKSSVGVRMPANAVAREFISTCGVPVAAPSANKFGMLSPTSAKHVEKQLGDKVNLILDGGESDVGVESTIIEYFEGKFFVLRYGGLPVEEIESTLGEKLIFKQNEISPNSPGQLKSHYAPRIPIYFFDEAQRENVNPEKTGLLLFKENPDYRNFASVKVLSPSGDLREASANLFKYLHEFENESVELILAEKIPQTGLGKAIMDRLQKAVNHYR